MKKIILSLSTITLILAACGGSTTNESTSTSSSTTTPAKPAMSGGELLIVKSDCIGCHNKEERIIGPAYGEIAAKYEANSENINALADKIINGSKGVWGEIPMTPHPKTTQDEAKQMVEYILSLKK
ncbi:hypothetical protein D9M68_603990 [compost metagenome]